MNPISASDHENAVDFRKVSALVRTEKSGNIFEHKPSGSKFAQDSRKLVKEACTLALEPRALARDADVLAGDSRCDAIDGTEVFGAALTDVGEALDVVESFLKDATAERVDFNLPDGFPAALLEAKIKPSNPRK